MSHNFALVGAGGYVAPRHLKAIRETQNRLVAAVDPHDAVGHLDQYGFDVRFFTEIERFDRHLEKLRRGPDDERVHFVSICSPNYLHDAHCRLALRVGAVAICEKPLVINPWNLDALEQIEHETSTRIFTVLQLRLHPALAKLRETLVGDNQSVPHEVELTYITARGGWYHVSWKGSEEKSGGVATNIGIHLFDVLLWLFGPVEECRVHLRERSRMAGVLHLRRATVRWYLSVDPGDLAITPQPAARTTYRAMTIDGRAVDFTEGFADLHTRVYEAILDGRGFGISDARPSIELVHRLRTLPVSPVDCDAHPVLAAQKRG